MSRTLWTPFGQGVQGSSPWGGTKAEDFRLPLFRCISSPCTPPVAAMPQSVSQLVAVQLSRIRQTAANPRNLYVTTPRQTATKGYFSWIQRIFPSPENSFDTPLRFLLKDLTLANIRIMFASQTTNIKHIITKSHNDAKRVAGCRTDYFDK